MSLRKKWFLAFIPMLLVISFFLARPLYCQKTNREGVSLIPKKFIQKQDSLRELNKKNVIAAELDTNFTWEKYAAFLYKVSDTSKYIVLPLNEFRETFNSKKIVIGLRHDVDIDLNVAYKFSLMEAGLGFRSTYFILHSAPYYLVNSNNMAVHNEDIIPILKSMQNDHHFEIGWHNDLVTLQVIYNINPVSFFHSELNWLRSNGLNIIGTAAHGSNYCKTLHYMNFYFFEECTFPVVPNRENNITVLKDGKLITLIKGKLSDFDLKYEAYFLNNNKAFSDAVITNGIRWNIGMLDLSQLQAGDRAIILLHPIHWHKGSVHTNIEAFSIPGQKSSLIDTVNSKVTVIMPNGTKLNSLTASYSLSPGAYAKVSGKLQYSRSSTNNFTNLLIYRVYAENRSIKRDWTIEVRVAKNSATDFLSFSVPGLTKSVVFNASQKTILVEVSESADLKHIPVQFDVSPGATVWNGGKQKFSNVGTINFSGSVPFRILAEDGNTSATWIVTVKKIKNLADFVSFSFPGQVGQSDIDTSENTINAKIENSQRKDSLRPTFVLSENSHAWIGNEEQISGLNYRDFSNPVLYDIISSDSLIIKKWRVSVLDEKSSVINDKPAQAGLLIYPNPTEGKIHLHFVDVKTSPTTIDIYNSMGEKVFTEKIKKTGEFIADEDLKKLRNGVYFVKYSEVEKTEIIVLKKH